LVGKLEVKIIAGESVIVGVDEGYKKMKEGMNRLLGSWLVRVIWRG